jgi:autotransporter passenger strand-loop-strand repeat protein
MLAASAVVELSASLYATATDVLLSSGDRLSVYSGESVSVSTEDVTVSAGGDLTAFAG